MEKFGFVLLQWSLGITFIWFGLLKPFGLSPAEELAMALIDKVAWWIPYNYLLYIGLTIMEIAIIFLFLFRKTFRIAIFLLLIQMLLSAMPLLFLPELTFVDFPFVLTLEGQYIIKNIVLISGAIVLCGTVRQKEVFNNT
ncbi:MAG: hypothetical protein ACXAC7_05915 [Candidatus Hodarchaeales archaeon]|jgi:uncharacterized membrane protein YkgB